MWRELIRNIIATKPIGMTKRSSMHVHGTKEGALFIKPSELFSNQKVQSLIKRINDSPRLQSKQSKREK